MYKSRMWIRRVAQYEKGYKVDEKDKQEEVSLLTLQGELRPGLERARGSRSRPKARLLDSLAAYAGAGMP